MTSGDEATACLPPKTATVPAGIKKGFLKPVQKAFLGLVA